MQLGISQQELADMLASAKESQEVRDIYLSVINNTLFGKAANYVQNFLASLYKGISSMKKYDGAIGDYASQRQALQAGK